MLLTWDQITFGEISLCYNFLFSTSGFCEQVAEVDLEVMFQNLDLKEFEIDLGERNIGIINRDVCGAILSLHPHRAIRTIYLAKAVVGLPRVDIHSELHHKHHFHLTT